MLNQICPNSEFELYICDFSTNVFVGVNSDDFVTNVDFSKVNLKNYFVLKNNDIICGYLYVNSILYYELKRSIWSEIIQELSKCINNCYSHYIMSKNSSVDPLTGVCTRYALKEVLLKQDYNKDIYIVETDIDDFKKFNDNYGHPIGDLVLKNYAKKLIEIFGVHNVLRFGGEEFILFVNDSIDVVRSKLDVLYDSLRNYAIIPSLNNARINISCGVSILKDVNSFSVAYESADKKLYIAKNTGKCKYII